MLEVVITTLFLLASLPCSAYYACYESYGYNSTDKTVATLTTTFENLNYSSDLASTPVVPKHTANRSTATAPTNDVC